MGNVVVASRLYALQNSTYSVHALVDDAGAVVERYSYTPYGEVTILSPAGIPLPVSAVGNNYLFTGRELDAETGHFHFRARAYAPKLGRFLQRDPSGFADGMNLYEYLRSRPTWDVDPYGEQVPPRGMDRPADREYQAYREAERRAAEALAAAAIRRASNEPGFSDYLSGVHGFVTTPAEWKRSIQGSIDIAVNAPQFIAGFALGFPGGIPKFGESLGELAWNIGEQGLGPVFLGMIDGAVQLVRLIGDGEFAEALKTFEPELHKLLTEWDKLGYYDRGYRLGKIAGEKGAAYVTQLGFTKLVAKVRARIRKPSGGAPNPHVPSKTGRKHTEAQAPETAQPPVRPHVSARRMTPAEYEHHVFGRPGRKESFDAPEAPRGPFRRRPDDFDPDTGTIREASLLRWSELDLSNPFSRDFVEFQRKLGEAAFDGWLLKENTVKKVIWYGPEPLPATGPASQLTRLLQDLNIEYRVVPVPQ
jgi:RHS repeat-associated protein